MFPHYLSGRKVFQVFVRQPYKMNYLFMILIKILFDKTLFIASTKETLPNRLVGYSVISLAVHVPSKIPYWFLISPVFNFAFFAIVKKRNEIKEPRK